MCLYIPVTLTDLEGGCMSWNNVTSSSALYCPSLIFHIADVPLSEPAIEESDNTLRTLNLTLQISNTQVAQIVGFPQADTYFINIISKENAVPWHFRKIKKLILWIYVNTLQWIWKGHQPIDIRQYNATILHSLDPLSSIIHFFLPFLSLWLIEDRQSHYKALFTSAENKVLYRIPA